MRQPEEHIRERHHDALLELMTNLQRLACGRPEFDDVGAVVLRAVDGDFVLLLLELIGR
jgi:hypothetical protein